MLREGGASSNHKRCSTNSNFVITGSSAFADDDSQMSQCVRPLVRYALFSRRSETQRGRRHRRPSAAVLPLKNADARRRLWRSARSERRVVEWASASELVQSSKISSSSTLVTFPSPLVGEGREGGREATRRRRRSYMTLPTPTPNPSPQGGGESRTASTVLATHARPSYVNAIRKIVPRSMIASRLNRRWDRPSARSCPTNKREAERRQAPWSTPRPHLIFPRLRRRIGGGAARAQRSALACRRSTAALAAANQRHSSAPERASWDVEVSGSYPPPPVPVQRQSRRPVFMPAGRLPGAARERR